MTFVINLVLLAILNYIPNIGWNPIAVTSAIDVLAGDILASQQCSRSSHRFYYSSSDNGHPIVVALGAFYSIDLLLSDFVFRKYTTASRSYQYLTDTTQVFGHGPFH